MRNAWIRYRIMAYVVGTLLVILVCVGLPLKYLSGNPTVVTWTAIPHGYLYMILLITVVDLGLRAKWAGADDSDCPRWHRSLPLLRGRALGHKNIRAKLAQAEAPRRRQLLPTPPECRFVDIVRLPRVASRSAQRCAPSRRLWRTR